MALLYKLIVSAIDGLKERTGLMTLHSHTLQARSLGAKSIVLDLGANTGGFSSAIASRFNSNCYALEAVPSTFAQIPAIPRVRSFNLAISDRTGPMQIVVSGNSEASSIYSTIAAEHGIRHTETCDAITLQEFLARENIKEIDLLKVDIEGSEEPLFDSTPDDLLRKIRQITIEFHDFVPGSITTQTVNRILRRLESLGFRSIPFSYLFPTMLNADILLLQDKACGVTLSDRVCFFAMRVLLGIERAKSGILSKIRGPAQRGMPA